MLRRAFTRVRKNKYQPWNRRRQPIQELNSAPVLGTTGDYQFDISRDDGNWPVRKP